MKRMGRPTGARLPALVAAALATSLVAGAGFGVANASPAGHLGGPAAAGSASLRARMLTFQRQHGYLPLKGFDALRRAKAHAAAVVASRGVRAAETAGGAGGAGPFIAPAKGAPKVGSSWLGPKGPTPPDANGAVGPNSYIEITNGPVSIFERDGTLIATANLNTLTGNSSGGDPMVLWDPDTQRFYYSAIGPTSTIDWGFSKSADPRSIPGDCCAYDTSYGFPQGTIPDYPKLGQTKGFLMVGINLYPPGSQMATEGDLLWTQKPQGSKTIKKCPKAESFTSGLFRDLRNQDGSQAFTPVPAVQTDPSSSGYVMAMSDIECPPTCGTGTLLTVYTLKPKKGDPTKPALSKASSMTVGDYESPPDAPQKGTDRQLDTLDGRITHAVSGVDPRVGSATVWVSHCVLGGAGAEVRWYEVSPGAHAHVVQSGAATSSKLYVYNGGISNDRTVDAKGNAAHGSAMVMGFDTSSSKAYLAVQMVSKRGRQMQSGFVLVYQSTGPFDPPGTCGDSGCRWGDYSGATPDPAASLSKPRGEVWLTNEITDGDSNRPTWNWEALP
jgi:hypothetical protein